MAQHRASECSTPRSFYLWFSGFPDWSCPNLHRPDFTTVLKLATLPQFSNSQTSTRNCITRRLHIVTLTSLSLETPPSPSLVISMTAPILVSQFFRVSIPQLELFSSYAVHHHHNVDVKNMDEQL